jgi:hypothetical protein
VPERCRAQPGEHPRQVGLIGHLPGLAGELFPWLCRHPGQQPPEAFGLDQRLNRRAPLRRDQVPQGLPVAGDEGIQADELRDPVWRPVGDAVITAPLELVPTRIIPRRSS